MTKLTIATRRSPLALVQSQMVASVLRAGDAFEVELMPMLTTGDRQTDWSLETKGGKGLFTSELEAALIRNAADLAVHSTKDLPGEMRRGLTIAGYLPRADPRDVLILHQDCPAPATLATGSPRRRLQLASMFPGISFLEIRGNVETRLKKIAEQKVADGTVLAAAGLARLGIVGWPGLQFLPLAFGEMVPAVGQAAIAVQSRAERASEFSSYFDAPTARAIGVERALQAALGAGCQTAFAAHAAGDTLYFFHEACGLRTIPLASGDYDEPGETASRVLDNLGLSADEKDSP